MATVAADAGMDHFETAAQYEHDFEKILSDTSSSNDTSSQGLLIQSIRKSLSTFLVSPSKNKSLCLSRAEWAAKEAAILQCLEGSREGGDDDDDDDCSSVNLWALRELSLQPGGLLGSELRKRAWPQLMLCHVVARAGMMKHQSSATPPAESVAALREGVKRVQWSIEAHLRMARQQRYLLHQQLLQRRNKPTRKGKVVRFSFDEDDKNSMIPPPPVTETSPTASFSDDEQSLSSPTSVESDTVIDTNHLLTTPSAPPKIPAYDNRPSAAEQAIVSNILLHLLRTEATPNAFFEDDRYHYHDGLADLAALILMQVESPSLSSLILQQLATWHLRDTLRCPKDLAANEKWSIRSLLTLLQHVDADLAHIMNGFGTENDTVATTAIFQPWMVSALGWFTMAKEEQDNNGLDASVAARLMDVFMVSHALFPTYLAVAVLTEHRKTILQMLQYDSCQAYTSQYVNTLIPCLRQMPLACFQDMPSTEQTIQRALHLMAKFSPEHLVAGVRSRMALVSEYGSTLFASAVALDEQAPKWSTLSSIHKNPSKAYELDWEPMEERKTNHSMWQTFKYSNAFAAVGFRSVRQRKQSVVVQVFVMVVTVSVGLLIISSISHPSELQKSFPAVEEQQQQPDSLHGLQDMPPIHPVDESHGARSAWERITFSELGNNAECMESLYLIHQTPSSSLKRVASFPRFPAGSWQSVWNSVTFAALDSDMDEAVESVHPSFDATLPLLSDNFADLDSNLELEETFHPSKATLTDQVSTISLDSIWQALTFSQLGSNVDWIDSI